MGIEIKVATRLEPLLDALAQDLSKLRGNDPLKQPVIVVGTRGMERWVVESIARKRGSVAHVEMVFPEKLMQMIALPKAAVDGTNPLRRATWKRERLRWEVLQELRAPHAGKEYDALLKLLSRGAAGDAGEVGRNWVAMATRLADGMERMVYYRPAWVAAFRAGEVPAELADWRREQDEGEGVSGWSEAYARLVQKLLARRGPLVQEWIEEASVHRGPIPLSRFGATKCSVHLFANSAPSPIMLRALRAISQSKPVILYVLEPTEAFLDPKLVRRKGFARVLNEEQYSHPMLFGGGQQTLELRALLEQEFADAQEQREPEMPVVFDEQGASLLQLVQERLAQGVPRGEEEFAAAESERDRLREDESILVLKTVDDRRQVEVLRDELLALFARGGVAPDEVVVMSPRLAEFAPLIRQVFSGVGLAPAASTVPTIPYVMVSDAGGEQRPIAAALSLLLEAASGRFDATFCHRWLTLSAVMQAWGLPDDISELSTSWFASSNARWGLDEDDRQSRVDNIGGRMGMEAGIERMALGLLTGERPESLTERAPAEVAGGIQTRDLAAAVRSLDAVASAVRVFRDGHGGRPVSAWVESVRGWLGGWFGGWKFAEERYAVERVMDALAEQSTEAAAVEITAAAFAEVLQAELEQVRNKERKQGAGVTFCSLVPMRAIPFKAVVLMGLEASAFPRRRDDDRLQPLVHLQKGAHVRPCDPDSSREDRHLFLEAFGMARDRFWVIANGFEGKSGEPLAESAPVLELMDCVRLVRGETSNRTDSPRVTAARALLPAAVTYRSHTEVEEREAPKDVEPAPVEPKLPLSELLKAIMEPLRLFATKVLRVPLEDEETVTSDDPNGIDYLEQLKVCKVRVGVVTNPDKHASVSVDSAAEGGAAIADIDKLEADYAAAGAVAKGYLGLGAVDALRGRLASLEHELRRLEVFEHSWKELGGAAVGELDGGEETPPISIASDGVVSLIQPGPLLWSGSVGTPVVVSHSKLEKAAFEAIVTLALVRLASEQAPPVGLHYLWWDAKNESYKVGVCVWPEGLDAEGWLRELIRFRREAMQRLVLASRELLFGAVSSSKNIADGSWPEVLQRSLADVDPGLVARVGCLGWFFDLLRADPPAVKARPAGVPAVQEGEQAEGERSADDDAAGYLVDRVSSVVVKAVAESKGYDFPAGLMRDSVRAPYPRRAGSTKQPNWSATLHGDVAWWTAVVGLPVVFSAYAVHNGKGWAGKRTPHQSVPATAVAAAPGQASIATKEDA
jgi:exodeoxyribonuclease V gamma subunit